MKDGKVRKLEQLALEIRAEGHDHLWTCYILSLRILQQALGQPWLERHVIGQTAPTDFFRNDWSTDQRRNTHFTRVIVLAEMIFNLQAIPGIKSVIQKLKDDSPEAAFAELQTGQLLYYSQVPFNFVVPGGTKGADYDIALEFAGLTVCADTKCKIEATEKSHATLLKSFEAARRQLPGDSPGIVFVKTPPQWLRPSDDTGDIMGLYPEHAEFLDEAAQQFFRRGSGRIVSIIYYEDMSTYVEGIQAVLMAAWVRQNPRRRFGANIDWDDLIKVPETNQRAANPYEIFEIPRWISLAQITYQPGMVTTRL